MDQELDEFYVSLIAQFMLIEDDCEREIRILENKRKQLRSKGELN